MRRTRAGLLLQGSLQHLPDMDVVRSKMPAAYGVQVVTRELSASEFSAAQSLAESKYATREWTERV